MSSSKPEILLCGTIFWATEELNALKSSYTIREVKNPQRSAFLSDLKSGEYDGVAAIFHSGSPIGNFDKEVIEALPKSVKVMGHHGAGYDDVDIDACTAAGIQVSHTPAAVDDATATTAMYLILGALRQFYRAEQFARAGQFKKGTTPAHDPEGKTLGIVGMGGIGRALAKRAHGFDMKVVYHNRNEVDPSLLASFPKDSIKYISTLEELLSISDVVSLNLPLNAKTEKFFSTKQFNQMKKGAVLVNTARGGVVDEEAMLAALESGQLSTAGLDVFPSEPEINEKLRTNDKISILPHMGTETQESRRGMENLVLDNLVKGLTEGKVSNLVPEQKGKF